MTKTFTLAPGIYNLIPAEHDHDGPGRAVALDPVRAYNNPDAEDGEILAVERGDPADGPITELAEIGGHLIVVDNEPTEIEGSSTVTLVGPLTISDLYVLVPADAITANTQPDRQYAINWLSFELTGEQPLSVEGSVIRIGAMDIDTGGLGAVKLDTTVLDGVETDWGDVIKAGRTRESSTVSYVAANGDALNAILAEMPRLLDDGVLVILNFTVEQIERIESLFTPEADAFARDMRRQLAAGCTHTVLRPAIG